IGGANKKWKLLRQKLHFSPIRLLRGIHHAARNPYIPHGSDQVSGGLPKPQTLQVIVGIIQHAAKLDGLHVLFKRL
ncbi:MAG: hypothetical protein ACK5VX_08405, partial [Akkermansiaceae bacterium]